MTSVVFRTAALLVCSNVFMTFAWYAHLRDLRSKPLLVAVAASWAIAFFEYLLHAVKRDRLFCRPVHEPARIHFVNHSRLRRICSRCCIGSRSTWPPRG
jgi:uncharacterized protein (DUF486 family)